MDKPLTTEEQRQRLEALGWELLEGATVTCERWHHQGDNTDVVLYAPWGPPFKMIGMLARGAEFHAIIHPPQGVVVPVEVIKQAIKILDTHIAYTINALGWGAVPVVRDTRIALADAIKEGDAP